MTDPRWTDPRYSDPRSGDTGLSQADGIGGIWGWITGIAAVVLIAFLVIAGMNAHNNTASNAPSPATSSPASGGATPPSTTGSGTTSPQPLTPARPNAQ